MLDVFAVVGSGQEVVGDGFAEGGVFDEVAALGERVFVDDVVGEG